VSSLASEVASSFVFSGQNQDGTERDQYNRMYSSSAKKQQHNKAKTRQSVVSPQLLSSYNIPKTFSSSSSSKTDEGIENKETNGQSQRPGQDKDQDKIDRCNALRR
jgi:hypothetical protein